MKQDQRHPNVQMHFCIQKIREEVPAPNWLKKESHKELQISSEKDNFSPASPHNQLKIVSNLHLLLLCQIFCWHF